MINIACLVCNSNAKDISEKNIDGKKSIAQDAVSTALQELQKLCGK